MAFKEWHYHHGQEPIRIPAIGLELRVCLPQAASDKVMEVIETTNAPGFGPPLHSHGETEVFRVLEGRYLYEVDGRRFIAEAGDVVSIPGDTPHGFVNITDAPARQLVIITPAIDAIGFFTAMGNLTADGLKSREELNAFGAAWGVRFLGPPLKRDETSPI